MKKILFVFIILLSFCFQSKSFSQAINVATFNIQNLGMTKINRPQDVNVIVSIIRSYDIVAIQEISDSSNRVAGMLLQQINRRSGPQYAMSLSPRTGQQQSDLRKAEQYAFYYRTNLVEILENHLFNDERLNNFAREPWIARFRTLNSQQTFVVITIHTVPINTISEINGLHYVVEETRNLWPQENNYIILGDMNAACQYATSQEVNNTLLHSSQYVWIVPDSADTNVASTNCAYDRIIITENMRTRYSNNWGIIRTITRTTSDHYPVWFRLQF